MTERQAATISSQLYFIMAILALILGHFANNRVTGAVAAVAGMAYAALGLLTAPQSKGNDT